MEIKNTALDQAAAQRQRMESGAKPAKEKEAAGSPAGDDRVSISDEAGKLSAEPGSGRITDLETARETLRELREAIARDGGAALRAHGGVSSQATQLLAG